MTLIQTSNFSPVGNSAGVIPSPYSNSVTGESYKYSSKSGGKKRNQYRKTKKAKKNKRTRRTRFRR